MVPGFLITTALPLSSAVIVQLRVVEGEGGVYQIGSRATRGLTVQVTDETGAPVAGASVSFRLPDEGPGGVFEGGLRTQVVTTQADGRAGIWGMQWNKTPGQFEIRITAVKNQARAGLISQQYLSDAAAPKSGGTGTFQASHHYLKWLIVGGVVAAGAAGGMLFGRSEAAKAAAAGSTSATTPTVIGAPSITIGHP